MTLKALLWDVDGTLAETERDGHLHAFNQAFEAAGVPWRWSEQRYGELLRVAGGRERLLYDMQTCGHEPLESAERGALIERLHHLKNQFYAQGVSLGNLPLRAGVRELLDECSQAGLPLAIVTTTSRSNIDILLDTQLGPGWASRFASIVSAQEAPLKKPNPQAYLMALDALRIPPQDAVAIEDAPAGADATAAAGIPLIITRSFYFPDTSAANALATGPSLGSPEGWYPAAHSAPRIDLEQIRRWHSDRVGAAA